MNDLIEDEQSMLFSRIKHRYLEYTPTQCEGHILVTVKIISPAMGRCQFV